MASLETFQGSNLINCDIFPLHKGKGIGSESNETQLLNF